MKGVVAVMIAASLICIPLMADACSAELTFVTAEPLTDRTFRFTAPATGVWDTGDGGIYTGATITHTFSVSGLHRVTFTSGGTTEVVTALVVDREPVTTASTGTAYNYCPGLVNGITTDCPGLFWNPGTMSLTGIPAAAGDYTVTVDGVDFTLRVTMGAAQIDRSFDIVVEGLTVKVKAASAGTPGITYWWQVLKMDGSMVAEGVSSEQTFVLREPGDYIMKCTMRDTSLQTTVYSKQFTASAPDIETEDVEDKGFEVPVWAWVVIGAAALLILRRILI